MARKSLDKIPEDTPKNHAQQMKLEENASVFLFFASSVIEIVKRHINDTFGIFDKKNVFYMHGLRKNLANSGIQKKQRIQLQIISVYLNALEQLLMSTKAAFGDCRPCAIRQCMET